MATVNPSALGPKPQFELSSGAPAVGNKLFFYVAGSVGTKQTTYSSSAGSVGNTNPIILDALGMPTNCEIWFTAGQSYKIVYAPSTDTDPPTSPIWTIDNLLGINDTTSALTEWIAGPVPTYVSATQFTLVGDQTTTFTVGRRLKTTNSGGTVYSTITASAFAAATTVTVVNDASNLDAGLSAVSYGILQATNPSIPRLRNTGNITQSLIDSATTSWNTSLGQVANWSMAASRILAAPSPLQVGERYVLIITQDATGGRAVTWNAVFKGDGGNAMPQPSQVASAVTVFSFTSPDGTNLRLESHEAMVLLSTGTASNSATLDFTGLSGFESYSFILENIVPANDAATFQAAVSQDSGGTWKNGANNYGSQRYLMNWSAASSASGVAGVGTIIQLCGGVDNSAGNGLSGRVDALALNGSGRKMFNLHITYFDSAGTVYVTEIGGGEYIADTTACNGVRFNFSGGNISTGTIKCYGIRG